MVGGGNGQKERSTLKTPVSLFEKHEIMVIILSFSVNFGSEIIAVDCTDLHLDFNIFWGSMPPDPPTIGFTFRFLDFHSIPPLIYM